MLKNIDEKTKNLVIHWLSQNPNITDIVDTNKFNVYYPLDIEFSFNGKRRALEIKSKRCSVNDFRDVMCDKAKEDFARKCVEEGKYENVYVANIYSDGYVALANMLEPFKHDTLNTPHSTCFENNKYEPEEMSHYKQLFIYEIDENGDFLPCYRDENGELRRCEEN